MKYHSSFKQLIGLFAVIFVLSVAFCSCNTKKTTEELFEEQKSGVCMVLNSYYYEIELPNGSKMYCSGIDEDGDLADFTVERDEIQKHKQMAFGTAFFIDDKGTLMTNRHVVSPNVTEEVIQKATSKLFEQLSSLMQYAQQDYAEKFASLEADKKNCYTIDFWGNYVTDYEQLARIEQAEEELASNYREAQQYEEAFSSIDRRDIKVRPVNEIGLAYNDTYVTSIDDFLSKNPCVVVKLSDKEDVDLATIQLKNKKTPEGLYVFKINGRDVIEKDWTEYIASIFQQEKKEGLQVNQDLHMIGFNAGPVLGNTKQGIQAQLTIGKITQNPDGSRILYSIPTLQGSSGSPVIDDEGYVRAVNFAKLGTTENFNFGIPDNQIVKFLAN